MVVPRRYNALKSMCRSAVLRVIPFWDKGDNAAQGLNPRK